MHETWKYVSVSSWLFLFSQLWSTPGATSSTPTSTPWDGSPSRRTTPPARSRSASRPGLGPSTSPRTRRSSVSILEVGAIPRKMTLLPALIAAHARIKSSSAASLCSWPSNGHTNSSPTHLLSICSSASIICIILVFENNKCKARGRFSQPDFYQRTIFWENLL